MTERRPRGDSWQGARWVLGTVLLLQGFGSAATEALWNTGFGAAGMLRAAGLPHWTDFAVGAAGAALLVWAAARTRRSARA
jgi:hypothetical protein